MASASIDGTLSFIVTEAKAVRRPLVRIRSLAETGTPASAPNEPPLLRRASSASAAARAPSASSVAMGLNGSAFFVRSSRPSTISRAATLPEVKAFTWSATVRPAKS